MTQGALDLRRPTLPSLTLARLWLHLQFGRLRNPWFDAYDKGDGPGMLAHEMSLVEAGIEAPALAAFPRTERTASLVEAVRLTSSRRLAR